MKKILVPTDYSDLSGYALSLAYKMAIQGRAEIYTLKVVPVSADVFFDLNGELADGDYDIKSIKAEELLAKNKMTVWLEKLKIPAIPIVKIGNLTDQILTCIIREEIDLVLMGTHGIKGIRELIADSVTGQIIRQSSVPVLSIKCDRSDLVIKNIVLASNFEEGFFSQIYFIKKLQQAYGAKIHLLRVNTSDDFKSTRILQDRMNKFAERNELENFEYHIYCDKDVESGILHFSEDYRMDLIGIGVEPESLTNLFHKQISTALVHHVYPPVLTFKILKK